MFLNRTERLWPGGKSVENRQPGNQGFSSSISTMEMGDRAARRGQWSIGCIVKKDSYPEYGKNPYKSASKTDKSIENRQLASKQMKRCSVSFIIEKCKLK